MATCASGLLLNPAKVPNFHNRAWWYSIDQEFHDDCGITQESLFWATALHGPTAIIRPKSQISNIGHDGTLSIRNFMTIMKNTKNLFFEPLRFIDLRPWYGQSSKFPILDMMVLYRSEILSILFKLLFLPGKLTSDQKMCSLCPCEARTFLFIFFLFWF